MPRSYGRRRDRAGEAGRDIVEAAERLLASTSLAELKVEDICVEAGVSRATFYHYFGSKTAVLAALAGELWDRVFSTIAPFVEATGSPDPQTTLRETFGAAWSICVEHSAVFRALAENWHSDPELGRLWTSIIERFTDAIALEIDRERAAGKAPAGAESRQLAAVLLWSTAHCLYVGDSGVDADMQDTERLFDTVMSVWIRAVYGAQS